jgi:hypothetical protein
MMNSKTEWAVIMLFVVLLVGLMEFAGATTEATGEFYPQLNGYGFLVSHGNDMYACGDNNSGQSDFVCFQMSPEGTLCNRSEKGLECIKKTPGVKL